LPRQNRKRRAACAALFCRVTGRPQSLASQSLAYGTDQETHPPFLCPVIVIGRAAVYARLLGGRHHGPRPDPRLWGLADVLFHDRPHLPIVGRLFVLARVTPGRGTALAPG